MRSLIHRGIYLLLLFLTPAMLSAQKQTTWRFDRLDRIGRLHPDIIGNPSIIKTDIGKAIHFGGYGQTGDAIFLNTHPLAGASTWTWEVIFRPSSTGAPAQRFFHLQETDPITHADTNTRLMLEIRIIDGKWCLDSFASSGPSVNTTLIHCDADHMYPFGRWYRIALTYDGTTLRNYVDNQLQGEEATQLKPQGPGHSSIGTRINRRDYFRGEAYSARFTPGILPPRKLLKVPSGKK